MGALLRFFSWRHGRKRPVRVLLGMAAVALGVVLYVSIDIAQTTVERSFEKTVDDLAGRAEWQVTRAGGTGVDEAALEKLRDIPGAYFAPVIQRSIVVGDATVLVLGVDFWRDTPMRMYTFEGSPADMKAFVGAALRPGTIVVTRAFAARRGLKVGSKIEADTPRGHASLVVGGILEAEGPARVFGGNFAIMELRAAQSLFGLKGRVDRIDVAGAAREKVEAALGPAYAVGPVSRRNAVVDDALARIRSMASISAIALVVGLFIIYNSVSISVVERVREIGILRSVGATRRQILSTVVLEWTLVGFAGSVAGVALGWALARGLVAFTAKTVNMYALAVDVSRVVFSWPGAVVAVAAGTAVAAGAALLPGLEAMGITPVGLLRQGTFQYRASPRYRRSFAVGVALIAASAAMLAVIPTKLPTAGLLAVSTVAFFAIALCGPQVTVWIAQATRPLLRRFFRVEGYLAADNVSKFPQRTALTVVAFGGAVAMMVASASIVESFDRSGTRWLDEALPFDLTLNCTDLSGSIYSQNAYEDAIVAEVQGLDGVELAYGVRSTLVPFGGTDVMLLAIEMDGYFDMHGRRGSHWTGVADTPELRSGACVLVSENFAYLRGVRAGESMELPTPDGPRRFAVAGLVEDYSWPGGTVLIDRFAYRRIWADDTVTYTDVRAKPGAKARARSELVALVKGRGTFFVYEVSDLKKVARDTMDQGMALVNVQVLIAMGIGFLGIVNTLLISVLRRTREIGLLRAVGATRAQVRRTIVIEAVFIAFVGAVLGAAAGLVGAAVPLRMFTLRITGFWVPFAVPWPTLALAAGAALVLGLVASWVPARRAGRMDVLGAIAYE